MSQLLVPAANAWWHWMVPASLQATVVFAVAVLLDRLLSSRAWPQVLCALWLAVLARFAMPPSIGLPPGPWWPAAGAGGSTSLPAASGGPARAAAFLIWAVGAAGLAGAAFARYVHVRRGWYRSSRPTPAFLEALARAAAARLGLRAPPRILVAEGAIGPLVAGVFSPVVVLPSRFLDGAGNEECEHVLLHELAHIQRRDALWAVLAFGLWVLAWPHPAAWIARRRLADVRELACDHAVVAGLGGAAHRYRRTLLKLARPLVDGAGVALGFLPRPSQLLLRLGRLERPWRPWTRKRRLLASSLGAVFLVLMAVAAPAGGARTPPQEGGDLASMGSSPGTVAPDRLAGCLRRRYLVWGLLGDPKPMVPSAASISPNSQPQ